MAPREERVGGSTLNERILGRGWELIQPIEAAYERGEIDATEWHARIGGIIGPAYASATDPRAQSGFSGSAEDWEGARRFIFTAVNRDGTFLDVGCANGHLMECAVRWLADAGVNVEPYGLEILPNIAALARRRLPHWSDRITVGNALYWVPDRPFDFVRTGLEYVPASLRAQLVGHLLENVVAPGGRLIVGAYSEPAGSPPHVQAEVASWGFTIAGAAEVPHAYDYRVVRRAFWLDKPLSGGNMAGEVIRVGGAVRRRTGPWTPAVHDLLRHLERVGFSGAPRVLGTDAVGREVLTYIPGEVAHPRVLDDAELASVARLISEYHARVESFRASPHASWGTDGQDPSAAHELVCHNDLAPWNLVVGTDGKLAFIDWDLAAPGRRLWDLALAACTFVPMYPSAARQLERFRIFCDAYDMDLNDRLELLDVTAQRIQRMWQVLVDNADRNPYASLVREGHADFWHAVVAHVRHQAGEWRRAASV